MRYFALMYQKENVFVKRSRGTKVKTGPKLRMSPPHLPSKGNPATKLNELGARQAFAFASPEGFLMAWP